MSAFFSARRSAVCGGRLLGSGNAMGSRGTMGRRYGWEEG